ncbi:MAG: efflux RND transporter permease subunit, partial [Planctomycetaceae bacterium]
MSVIWVEFDWGSDIFQDRQIVAEKLQLAQQRLPADVNPVMAPVSSIMGEIMLLGLRYTGPALEVDARHEMAMELRTLGEFTLRNRLLSVAGISQVSVMGGVLKQFQILTSPDRLAAQNITLEQLVAAAEKANVLAGGGFMNRSPRESLIRINGQSHTIEDIENTPVVWRSQRAILLKEVADVRTAGPVRRGDGSVLVRTESAIEGGPAVILAVQKQPHADTLKLDTHINQVLDELQRTLPEHILIEKRLFRQADFIEAAVDNVVEAVRDGAIWVVVVLFLFMWNLRTSISSLTAMPLSILLTILAFRWFGISINTMTLGGIAVAIGDLVDDSIVDIENIYRRLKENRHSANPAPALSVIYEASCEVRNSIVYATLIVVLVVFPLFSLAGLEGRIFAPLGVAYMTSLLASLAVSLTVTPVLASLLLPNARFLDVPGDPLLLRILKIGTSRVLRWTLRHTSLVLGSTVLLVAASLLASLAVSLTVTPVLASLLLPNARFLDVPGDPFLLRILKFGTSRVLRWTLRHTSLVLGSTVLLVAASLLTLGWMGGEFLPPFNEGTFTINFQTEPGTSLEESQRLASQAEQLLLQIPEVLAVSRRTGRAELDEHAEGVNSSEFDVRVADSQKPVGGWFAAVLRAIPVAHILGYETTSRPRHEVLADIRDRVTLIPGARVNIGQPISHRLDHIMSGIRAQVAVKIFGSDLRILRDAGHEIHEIMSKVPGVVDLQLEPQVEVSQIRLQVRRDSAARCGLAPDDIAKLLETACRGRVVSQI